VDGVAWHDRVGQRVVVRSRLDDGTLGDVVGELTDVDTHLHVRTRTGVRAVPLDLVVAGKVVPPRPVRQGPPHLVTSITDLEAVASLHWRAAETERTGGWLMRASGGFTHRANSALPLAHVHGDLPARPDAAPVLEAATAWYSARGLPARVQLASVLDGGVPDDHGPSAALLAACRREGWRLLPPGSAVVMTAPTADLRRPPALPAGYRLEVADAPDDAWVAAYRAGAGPLPPAVRPLLVSAPDQAFFSVHEGGTPVGIARGSLGGGWAGLTAVEVTPAHRRRGLARALLARVADWAWRGGARSTFLQVGVDNITARQLYAAAGFALHHRYDYYEAPGPS